MKLRWPNVVTISETPYLNFCWNHNLIAVVPSSFRLGKAGTRFDAISWRYVFSYAGLLNESASGSEKPLRGVYPLPRVILLLYGKKRREAFI